MDPSTGPIPRSVFEEIVAAPHGKARDMIRKYDPLWGRVEGESIKWRVEFRRRAYETGYATVEATSKEDAEREAEKIEASLFNWEPDHFEDDVGDIQSVEPCA